MACKSCGSENLDKFGGEVALHFRGLENLGKPIIWAFPLVSVCLNCGHAEFAVPENQLSRLATGGRQIAIEKVFKPLDTVLKSGLDN
jgi:hypothetical protein